MCISSSLTGFFRCSGKVRAKNAAPPSGQNRNVALRRQPQAGLILGPTKSKKHLGVEGVEGTM